MKLFHIKRYTSYSFCKKMLGKYTEAYTTKIDLYFLKWKIRTIHEYSIAWICFTIWGINCPPGKWAATKELTSSKREWHFYKWK